MNHCFGYWVLSLLLLAAFVTTTQLEQGLTVKEIAPPPHELLPTTTAFVVPKQPRLAQLTHGSLGVVVTMSETAMAPVTTVIRQREPPLHHSLILPLQQFSSSPLVVQVLKPALLEVAVLMLFQVVGIPILSKLFAICANARIPALLSRLPLLRKIKDMHRLKRIWKTAYQVGRPPLRFLRKAQKFIKKWHGQEHHQNTLAKNTLCQDETC